MKKTGDKFIFVGGLILGLLCFIAIFADFLAPYRYDTEERKKSYIPPSKLYFFSEENGLTPFIYDSAYNFDKYYQRVYRENRERKYFLKFFIRGETYQFLGLFPAKLRLFGVEEGTRIYLLGGDSRGRDIFSRILYALRISLSIGLIGALISYVLGLIFGGISGYYGGKVDFMIMRLCEMIMMVPGFYLMLSLRAAFPPELSSLKVYFLLIVIFSFIGWAGLARIIRGMVLSIKEREFVIAARALGVKDSTIIIKHVLPQAFSYVIISFAITIPAYILGESALSLIGLGIQEPYPSLGNLLSAAMNIAELKFHPWILFPGVVILIIVAAFNILGEGLRDKFDPHYK